MSIEYTYVFYMLIFAAAILCGFFSQKRVISGDKVTIICYPIFLKFSFIILWFIAAFTDIGVDYESYLRIIRLSEWESIWNGEVGFNVLCILMKKLCSGNYQLVIFFFTTTTMLIFYRVFYMLRNEISIGLGLIAFVLLSYFRFYLIAMHMSSALLLLSFVYLIHGKRKKTITTYIGACLIHYSAVLVLPAYIVFLWAGAEKKKISLFKLFLFAGCYIGVFVLMQPIYNFAVNYISIFSEYKEYKFIENYNGIGFMQFVFYIPVFYYVYLIYKNISNYAVVNTAVSFSITGFLFALLGYKFEVLSRMYQHFLCIYIIIIPHFLFIRKNSAYLLRKRRFLMNYHSDICLWSIYLIVRGGDILIDILHPASQSMMNSWRFFIPF